MTLAIAATYLLFWPLPIEPEAWNPPSAPSASTNAALAAFELLEPSLPAPEAITFDAEGRVVTGLIDGRIVRFTPKGNDLAVIARTEGRPLGLKYDHGGNLLVADAQRGLLIVDRDGAVKSLAASYGEKQLGFVDDVDVASDGTVYFSDASSRGSLAKYKLEVIEHRPLGRLFAYHPDGRLELLLEGLYFANGVALAPDASYVLVSETTSYRIRRFYLNGPKAGQNDIFVDNLPGFPDNITWSPSRRVFWVALPTPREPILDQLSPSPFLRKVVARFPNVFQPSIRRHAWAVAIDETGRIVADLQDDSSTSYSPLTSVVEQGGFLYLGSFVHNGVGRIAAPR
ncbi:MAG: SMP-30/gluconolactonase/LRE family protein [Polyangiaceae bacterium]